MDIDQNKTLVLEGQDVQAIVQHVGLNALMDELIRRLNLAVKEFDPGRTIVPVRSGFNYQEPHEGLLEWMPLLQVGNRSIIKIVGYHPRNPESYALPTILSTVSAYDTKSGHLEAMVDGVLLTALRTGAASAVASRYLANPESSTLGIIGCGAQAVTQLHALSRVFPIKKVIVYDISEDAMASFEARISILELDIPVELADPIKVVEAADILVTATTVEVGGRPLFGIPTTKPHLHINAVGSDFPGKVELPLELLKKSTVCPDFPEQAKKEGECQSLEDHEIGPDWITVIQNPANYHHLKSSLTVFDSTGWPPEDLVLFDLFLEYAKELGLGSAIDLELIATDAKNPYDFLKHNTPKIVMNKSMGS